MCVVTGVVTGRMSYLSSVVMLCALCVCIRTALTFSLFTFVYFGACAEPQCPVCDVTRPSVCLPRIHLAPLVLPSPPWQVYTWHKGREAADVSQQAYV